MRVCPYVGGYLLPVIERKGLTVTEVALRLGVSRSFFYRVLAGQAGVSPKLAIALEYVLGVRGDQVLRAYYERRLAEAREKERRRIVALSGRYAARPCHADVLALCSRGSQWCHLCRDWECNDNMNTERPVAREKPKKLLLRQTGGKTPSR